MHWNKRLHASEYWCNGGLSRYEKLIYLAFYTFLPIGISVLLQFVLHLWEVSAKTKNVNCAYCSTFRKDILSLVFNISSLSFGDYVTRLVLGMVSQRIRIQSTLMYQTIIVKIPLKRYWEHWMNLNICL